MCARSWKLEVGSRKSEVGSWKTLLGFRNFRQIQVERQWPLCVIASDVQISQPSLVWKQNSSHLHSLCVDILFNCTALGIHLCKTSQLYILKTRLGGEIYSSDVNMHKGYFAQPVTHCVTKVLALVIMYSRLSRSNGCVWHKWRRMMGMPCWEKYEHSTDQ